METVYSELQVGNLLLLRNMMLSHDLSKVNSFIVSKGAMKNFKEMFPPAKMFPLAVMTNPS